MDVPLTLHDGYVGFWQIALLLLALIVLIYCLQTIRIQEKILARLGRER